MASWIWVCSDGSPTTGCVSWSTCPFNSFPGVPGAAEIIGEKFGSRLSGRPKLPDLSQAGSGQLGRSGVVCDSMLTASVLASVEGIEGVLEEVFCMVG